MPPRPVLLLSVLAGLAPIACAVAADGDPAPARVPVASEWNARLRHEFVDDAAFARDASATTLRLRAGLRVGGATGFVALLEGEGTASAGNAHDSGSNRVAGRPAIIDPEGAGLNQAWAGWKSARFGATAGRPRLQFANQRWIGNSGWRQDEQTFDALALDWTPRDDLTVRHAWLGRVHRVAGDRARDRLARGRELDTHALDVQWTRGAHQLAAFGLWHDDRDLAAASTATLGLRAATGALREGRGWGLALEVAEQRPHADNPLRFRHRYWRIEPALTRAGVTWRAGWEHLGGDGRHALQAPLGSLHPFNGWADKFNATPPGGLDDRYLAAGGKFRDGRLDWQLAWHDYRADSGGGYGREWNAALGFPVGKRLKGLLKVADYQADGFARDTAKAWLQLEWTR